jgi:hypothetical protein
MTQEKVVFLRCSPQAPNVCQSCSTIMKDGTIKRISIAVDYELRIPTPAIKRWLLSCVIDELGLGLGNSLYFTSPSDLHEMIRNEGYANFLEYYDAQREANYDHWDDSQDEALAFVHQIMTEDFSTEEKSATYPLVFSYSFSAEELEFWLGYARRETMDRETVLSGLTCHQILDYATYSRLRLGEDTPKPVLKDLLDIRVRLRDAFPSIYAQ